MSFAFVGSDQQSRGWHDVVHFPCTRPWKFLVNVSDRFGGRLIFHRPILSGMCRDDEIATRSKKVWCVRGGRSWRRLRERLPPPYMCSPFGGLSRFTSFFVPLVFSDDNIYTTGEERITLTRKTCFPASRYEIHFTYRNFFTVLVITYTENTCFPRYTK